MRNACGMLHRRWRNSFSWTQVNDIWKVLNETDVNVKYFNCIKHIALRQPLLLTDLLMKLPADEKTGITPLMWIATLERNGDSWPARVTRSLIRAGANVNATDREGTTPLESVLLCENPDLKVALALVEGGADLLRASSHVSTTPLHTICGRRWASHYDGFALRQAMIKHGANVDAKDVDGDTPLMEACSHGYRCAVQQLLYAGANVDATDDEGDTALVKCINEEEKMA